MDMYSACEESYKNGFEKGYKKCKQDLMMQNVCSISSEDIGCIVITENVDGVRRTILAKTPFHLWANWNSEDAEYCPENDAPVYGFILNGEVICGDDGWDFEDVMNYAVM